MKYKVIRASWPYCQDCIDRYPPFLLFHLNTVRDISINAGIAITVELPDLISPELSPDLAEIAA